MSQHYTHIEDYNDDSIMTYWNQIELSPRTVQERSRIKSFIDDFASFTWRGIDAFETFGAFIINNKNSLKFYNGPTFSNEYTKPQFETAAGQLTGVTFQTQKIDFMIGVYWISEDHYRQMVYWLHPYEINTLTFGFEPNYFYQVKLASMDNGIRYIVGYEEDKPMYYTEMKITFEIQGAPVAYGNTYFAFKKPFWNRSGSAFHNDSLLQCDSALDNVHDKRNSDLETPLIIETTINLEKIIERTNITTNSALTSSDILLSATIQYNNQEVQQLFEVVLKNLHLGENIDNTWNHLNITYNSESALLFLQHGDSMRELLTKLTTLTSGDRIVDSMLVNQFRIPGRFDDYQFELKDAVIHFKLLIINPKFQFINGEYTEEDISKFFTANIYSRPRTNLI